MDADMDAVVADLRAGDVVEVTWTTHWDGTDVTHSVVGAVRPSQNRLLPEVLYVGAVTVRDGLGKWPDDHGRKLRVISRAPRLYSNHRRTTPIPGDVARWDDSRPTWTISYGRDGAWHNTRTGLPYERNITENHGLLLLVDGDTGQVVTS